MARPARNGSLTPRESGLIARNEQLERELDALREETTQLKAQLLALLSRGTKTERWDPGQLPLPFDGVKPTEPSTTPEAVQGADPETSATTRGGQKGRKKHPGRHAPSPLLTRKIIPVDLDRADLDAHFGPGNWTVNGHEVTEVLDSEPAQIFVNRYERRRYVALDDSLPPLVAQTSRFLPKAAADPGLIARIAVEKFDMGLPLYRQEQAFHRGGASIARSTMVGWLSEAARKLEPVSTAIREHILAQPVVLADETPLIVLDPQAKKGRKQGYVWGYGATDGYVWLDFQTSRGQAAPMNVLKAFDGTLVSDGYKVYEALARQLEDMDLAACWAHARRGFYKAKDQDGEAANHFLKAIAAIYLDERERRKVMGGSAAVPRAAKTIELVDHFESLVGRYRDSFAPSSRLGKAVAYVDSRMTALRRFLLDQRIPLDTNELERVMKLVAICRKNWLFFGSEEGGRFGAVLMTLVMSCRAIGAEAWAYLKFAMEGVASQSVLDPRELMPHAFLAQGGARRRDQG